MAIPLLGTDYFTKPEPQGSINSTVMRIMAQAGAAIGERVEKAQTQLEARTLAPVISKGYAGAYEKIAKGDFSGFADIASVKALAAANPLLASLSKDADSLAIHVANNVTQRSILDGRIQSQGDLQQERLKSAAELQSERLRSQSDLAEQRNTLRTDLADRKYDEQEAARVDQENAAISKRNEERRAAFEEEKSVNPKAVMEPMEPLVQFTPRPARTSSDNPLPTGEGGRVRRGPDGGVVTNPLGMVSRNNPDPSEKDDSPTGRDELDAKKDSVDYSKPVKSPTSDVSDEETAVAEQSLVARTQKNREQIDMKAFVQDSSVSPIMVKHGIMGSDLKTLQTEGNVISLTRSPDGKKITLSPEESQTFINTAARMDAERHGADPSSSVGHTVPASDASVSANPRPLPDKKVDEIQFGNVKFHIGVPSNEDSMKIKQKVIKTPSAETTYADPNFSDKEKGVESRTKFIEALGVMKTDPNAAVFVSDHLNDKGRGGVVFQDIERDKSGKVVLSARMYGIDEKGERVPYNPGPDGKTAGQVSGEFVTAYGDALKVMDTVRTKYGTKLLREDKPEGAKQPWDRVEDQDVKTAILQAQKDLKEGSITREEAKRRILGAQAKKEELNLVDKKFGTLEDVDKETSKAEEKKKPQQLKELKDQLKEVESKLSSGKETSIWLQMASGMSAADTGAKIDSEKEITGERKKKLLILRSNLQKKIKALE